MSIRFILVPAGPKMNIRPRLDAALRLDPSVETHIRVLYIGPNTTEVLASLTGIGIAIDAAFESLETESRKALEGARAVFGGWCADHGVVVVSPLDHEKAAVSASFVTRLGDVETILATEARTCDLVILDRPEGPNPFSGKAFNAAVFLSGRVALVTPPDPLPAQVLDSVVIAWNGSLEGARALAQSTALLRMAGRVAIFSAPHGSDTSQAAADLSRYLRWHGVVATHAYSRIDAHSTGQRLLATAREEDATMILMGAYTHSRAREFFLGGVTLHVLTHSHIPLLMAH